MAEKPKPRTILEPVAEAPLNSGNSPISFIAIANFSDDQALIYVGTFSGLILLYSFRSSETENIVFVKRVSISGSGSPVNSIIPISQIGKIVSLSDGFLFMIDASLQEHPKRISLIKGANAFCRKFRSLKGNSDVLLQRIESGTYPSNGRNNGVQSSGNNLFAIGIGKKLVLAELILGGTLVILKEIQGFLDGVSTTLLWIDDSIFAGTKSGYYLYNVLTGQNCLIFSLPDVSTRPLLKLLANEDRVLLTIDNVGIIVDTEGQPVGGSLVFKDTPDSLRELGNFVVATRKSKVELHHKKTGFCVQSLIADGDIGPCLVADEESGSGKLVAIGTSSKIVCYGKVSGEEQIKDLLRKRNFKEAISLIEELENEGEITKEMLSFIHAQVGFLLLFDLHFKDAVDHFLLSEYMQPSELFPFILRDPNRWTLSVPRNSYWRLHPPPTPLENLIDDGLSAIQRAIFLKKAGVEVSVSDEFLLIPPSRSDLLNSAFRNMIRYFETFRHRDLTLSVKEGVDTLLMYLYRAVNCVEEMEGLASSENSCVVEELESLLSESGHLRTLAFLYSGKGMTYKALAIWRLLARNYSLNSRNQYGTTESQEPSRSLFSQKTAAKEASKILEESSDEDLVLQHLGWIADIDQLLAVQILISENRENSLSPDKVISAIDSKKVEILHRYLQWLIEDQDSDDSEFHTTYALLLAKSTLLAYDGEPPVQNSVGQMPVNDLERSSIFESSVRERFQHFLQSSDLYDLQEVLEMIENSSLWLEKAIVYRKLGQESLVLQILALKLENCEAAEEYCAEIGRPDAYIELLDLYLNPKDGREPLFKAAVRLLHNNGEILDPMLVFEKLSSTMPLRLASATILRMLRARFHHRCQGQIVRNLSRALEVDASLARLEERSRHVLIDDESVCNSCHSRLGTKLFAMYPDDTIACYKCYRQQGESTSISNRDFRKDVLVKPGWLVTR